MRDTASDFSRAIDGPLAEQYYYVLLWKGRYSEAREYSQRVLQLQKAPVSTWLERTGDALFFEGRYIPAGQFYEQALKADPKRTAAYLKLSDVWFQLGNREKERFYREGIYGVLK
jgi:tetratricopeptide (TPR) repeat protein